MAQPQKNIFMLGQYALLFCFLTFFTVPTAVIGADLDGNQEEGVATEATGQDSGEVGEEGPSFNNAAQAQHAANLAAAAASQPSPEVTAALDRVAAAEQDLANAVAQEDQQAMEAAQATLDAAHKDADSAMAKSAGVKESDIAGMRADGMGWGQIAHELGVHPGVLGLGHTKGKKGLGQEEGLSGKDFGGKGKLGASDIREATSRNLKSGLSKGHGVNTGANSGSKGLGLDNAGQKSAAGKAGGFGGGPGSSKGGGQGNSGGGHGNSGNGGGKGGGKGK